jgi:hypothetical protein
VATGGTAALLATALAEALRLLQAAVHGNPYPRTLPKVFTNLTDLTLSATDGQDSDFLTSDYKNDGKYPFQLEWIVPHNVSSGSNWLLQVADGKTRETIFGAPNPIRFNQIIDANRQPTPIASMVHVIPPDGGFLPKATSVGTATVVQLALKGLWIVEEYEWHRPE